MLQNYLATYTVRANMFDGGCWMPDPEPHHIEYGFSIDRAQYKSKKAAEARANEMAEEHKSVIRKDYFGPSITLDRLLRVDEVAVGKLQQTL
ncbi:MAG: hypothetical protein V1743_07335 [Nanoarchaeota archaeon]